MSLIIWRSAQNWVYGIICNTIWINQYLPSKSKYGVSDFPKSYLFCYIFSTFIVIRFQKCLGHIIQEAGYLPKGNTKQIEGGGSVKKVGVSWKMVKMYPNFEVWPIFWQLFLTTLNFFLIFFLKLFVFSNYLSLSKWRST